MEMSQAELLREILAGTGLPDDAATLARALRRSTRHPSGLLVTGPPDDEPWHLTAHLDDEARMSGAVLLKPRLVRWNVHPGDPEHLSHGVSALSEARRGDSVLVVAATTDPSPPGALDPLLERVETAKKRGAGVFALQEDESELSSVATETVTLSRYRIPTVSFDESQHLVSLAVGRESVTGGPRGLRGTIGRLLDAWTGVDA